MCRMPFGLRDTLLTRVGRPRRDAITVDRCALAMHGVSILSERSGIMLVDEGGSQGRHLIRNV